MLSAIIVVIIIAARTGVNFVNRHCSAGQQRRSGSALRYEPLIPAFSSRQAYYCAGYRYRVQHDGVKTHGGAAQRHGGKFKQSVKIPLCLAAGCWKVIVRRVISL